MLIAQAISVFRAERLVLHQIALTAAPGGALVLAGPNGAGKSTLLRVLAGLLPPDAGHLTWQGAEIAADRTAHAARVGYLGHQDAIKPALTAAANLRLWGRPAAALAALHAVGLASLAELPSRLLSAGQRRRLAIARLVLAARPLWLLDEPTLGLDDASIAQLGALIAVHRAQGGIVIAATHVTLPLPNAEVLRLG